jgi:CO dehydrogenase/acetyl-CoA synthase beta subunit
MTMAWSEDVKKILEKGVSLSSVGIDNWALNKDQAMLAIDEFEKHKIPVLGGDVYEIVDGYPEANYDNWYCDRNANEDLEGFVARSVGYARDYIENYSNPSGRETYFVLVA